jgi:hypothetical protein
VITADATIIAPPRATPYQAAATILAHPHGEYSEDDIRTTIVPGYFIVCRTVAVDPLVGVAQMIHETGNLTSWWSQRPRRNPAGIGVTGHQTALGAGLPSHIITQWVAKDGRWVAGLTFRSWANDAIPAHVGRLVAYATKPAQRTEAQAYHSYHERWPTVTCQLGATVAP